MNHDRPRELIDFLFIFSRLWLVRTTVFQLEPLWQVEVELDGTALPFSFQSICELEVELKDQPVQHQGVHDN